MVWYAHTFIFRLWMSKFNKHCLTRIVWCHALLKIFLSLLSSSSRCYHGYFGSYWTCITFQNWKIPLTFCSTTVLVLNYNAHQSSKEKYHSHDSKVYICKSRILFLEAVFMEVIGYCLSDCWYEYKAAWWYPAICWQIPRISQEISPKLKLS